MDGQLQPVVIKERAEQLRSLASAKRTAFRQRFIGKTLQVLGQGHTPATGRMTGLSRNYLEVCYPADASLLNHEVVVQVEDMKDGQLRGSCLMHSPAP